MGVELELYVLLAIVILGSSMFSVFEVETPRLRKLFKWLVLVSVTIGLYYVVGHVALVVPFGALVLGATVHFTWCRRHGIDPIHATPRRRYYQLRGWQWPD